VAARSGLIEYSHLVAEERRRNGQSECRRNVSIELQRQPVPEVGCRRLEPELRLARVVRRELIDLSRRHGHAGAMARNHETNALSDGNGSQRIEYAIDHTTEPADRVADWTRFHDLAAELPEEQRQLFEMVWYVGMSQDEIAAALECSTRTVRRRWEETKARFTETFRGRPPE
jgi:RNA polymerase sigma factor (sigma-70 family)